MAWTEEDILLLRSMVTSGKFSYAAMTPYFPGKSRNAIIGKAQRLGMTNPTKERREEAVKRATAPKAARADEAKPRGRPRFRMLADDEPAPVDGVAFDKLQPHHCRWPSGDPRTDAFRFCGARRQSGCSYCSDHHALAYSGRLERRPYTPPKRSGIHIRAASGRY